MTDYPAWRGCSPYLKTNGQRGDRRFPNAMVFWDSYMLTAVAPTKRAIML